MSRGFWYRVMDEASSLRPLLVAIAFSPWLIILYKLVSSYVSRLQPQDQNTINNFIDWFGIAYGFLLPLVIVRVWEKFDALEREFSFELNAVANLYHRTQYIEESFASTTPKLKRVMRDIEEAIREYVYHVIDHFVIEDRFVQQRCNGQKILEGIGRLTSSLTRTRSVAEPIISELFKNLNEVMNARARRISYSKQHIPETIWVVTLIASIVWTLPFWGLVIESPLVKILLINGVIFVLAIILVIIKDLDEPYEGAWRIDLEEWDVFMDLLEPRPHFLFVFSHKTRFFDMLSRTSLGSSISLGRCQLSDLTREDRSQRRWKRFLDQLQCPRPRINIKARYDVLYADAYSYGGYARHVENSHMPLVVLRRGDDFQVLLSSEEICKISSFNEFEETFNQRVQQFLPGF